MTLAQVRFWGRNIACRDSVDAPPAARDTVTPRKPVSSVVSRFALRSLPSGSFGLQPLRLDEPCGFLTVCNAKNHTKLSALARLGDGRRLGRTCSSASGNFKSTYMVACGTVTHLSTRPLSGNYPAGMCECASRPEGIGITDHVDPRARKDPSSGTSWR